MLALVTQDRSLRLHHHNVGDPPIVKRDLDLHSAVDDMIIGDDVTVRGNDDSTPDSMLQRLRTLRVVFLLPSCRARRPIPLRQTPAPGLQHPKQRCETARMRDLVPGVRRLPRVEHQSASRACDRDEL